MFDQEECRVIPAAGMKRQLSHPTVEAVKAIHTEVLAAHGGSGGLREAALLESAVAAPQATMMGEPLFADPVDIAAAHLFYRCRGLAVLPVPQPSVRGRQQTHSAGNMPVVPEQERMFAAQVKQIGGGNVH